MTTVSRTAADLIAGRVDGGHIGRFLNDALNAGTITMVQLCERLNADRDEIESLFLQSGDHASVSTDD